MGMYNRMENQNLKFIFLMILLFNRHAGLVINCGKAIHEKLKKTLNGSPTLNISIWLDFTASNRLEGAIRNYETFRTMIERLVEMEMFRPAIYFLRFSFAGFLGSIQ